jgi:c-di-GMP-binding flagellar brake protein YcgR
MQERAKSGSVRRAPRLVTRLPAILQGRHRFDVEVLDLSLRGCLARCPSCLDRGLVMDLTLAIPGETFAAKVRVATASRDGEADEVAGPSFLTGLEFLTLPPGGEQALQRFLDQERRRRRADG